MASEVQQPRVLRGYHQVNRLSSVPSREILGLAIDSGLANTLRKVANSFSESHGVAMTLIYDWMKHRNNAYGKGDHRTVIATLSNLQVVDESQLAWEQVIEFRNDKENQEKYKRFLHWLSVHLAGWSQALVDEEIP